MTINAKKIIQNSKVLYNYNTNVKQYDAELQWIESPKVQISSTAGLAYIDTGITMSFTHTYLIDMMWFSQQYSASDTWRMFWGTELHAGSQNDVFLLGSVGLATSKTLRLLTRATTEYRVSDSADKWLSMRIDLSTKTFTCNNETVTSNMTLPLENSRSIFLFGLNSGGTIRELSGACRCRKYVVVDADTVIQDLIPVRFTNENGESEGAMYDKVSGKLFRNAGTGKFILGPDKNEEQ